MTPTPPTPRTPHSASHPYTRPTLQPGRSKTSTDLLVQFLGEKQTPDCSSSGISDDGSLFLPNTPSTAMGKHDVKPDLSEDDDNPFVVKQERKGPKAKGGKGTKRGGVGVPQAVGRAWTSQEDWSLFQQLHPKAKAEWGAVAVATGRDAKVRFKV